MTQRRGPLGHRADVAAAGLEEDGQLVPRLDAHAVDGHVGKPGIRVGGVAHAQRDVGSGVHGGIGRRGNQFKQVEVRVCGAMHDLLTGRGSVSQFRHDGVLGAPPDDAGQLLLLAPEQRRHPLPAGHHADDHAGVGMPFHVVEDHRGAVHRRGALHRATRAHVAIYARQLGGGIHLDVRLDQLPRHFPEQIQCLAQAGDFLVHGISSVTCRSNRSSPAPRRDSPRHSGAGPTPARSPHRFPCLPV